MEQFKALITDRCGKKVEETFYYMDFKIWSANPISPSRSIMMYLPFLRKSDGTGQSLPLMVLRESIVVNGLTMRCICREKSKPRALKELDSALVLHFKNKRSAK